MAVKRLFTNNAVSLLQTALSASSTTLSVIPGHGAMYPQPGANEIFVVTLEDQNASIREIVHVTARNGDTFTIVRGQEGTAPRAWSASSGSDTLVDHRVTADTLYYLKDELQQANASFSALTGNARDNPSLAAELDSLSDQIDALSILIAGAENSYSNVDFPALVDFKSALDYLLSLPAADLTAINEAIENLQDDNQSIHGDISDIGQELANFHTQIDNDILPALGSATNNISNLLNTTSTLQGIVTELQLANATILDYSNPNFISLTTIKKALDYILAQPLGAGGGGGEVLNLYAENSTGGVASATGNDAVALGAGSEAQANNSLAIGDQSLTRLPGMAFANGRFGTQGDAQTCRYIMRTHTINSIPTELFMDGTNGGMRLTPPDDSTWTFEVTIVGHQQDGNGHAGFRAKGVIYKVGSLNMLGAVSKETIASHPNWDVAVTVDGTNNALKITATGEVGKIIRWLAIIDTVEVTN